MNGARKKCKKNRSWPLRSFTFCPSFLYPLYFLSSLLSCFLFLTRVVALLISYRYIISTSHTIYCNSVPFTLISVNYFIYSFFAVLNSFLNYAYRVFYLYLILLLVHLFSSTMNCLRFFWYISWFYLPTYLSLYTHKTFSCSSSPLNSLSLMLVIPFISLLILIVPILFCSHFFMFLSFLVYVLFTFHPFEWTCSFFNLQRVFIRFRKFQEPHTIMDLSLNSSRVVVLCPLY